MEADLVLFCTSAFSYDEHAQCFKMKKFGGIDLTISDKRKERWIFICVMLFFLFTMIFKLTHSPLCGDEWTEYHYSQSPIATGELYEKIIYTFQPPLYNFIMHFWLMIDKSVLWFRLFNVVIGFISGFFLLDTIKKLTGSKIAAFAAIVGLACTYQWVYSAQECSEYFLMVCSLIIAIWAYVCCLKDFSYTRMVIFILANVAAVFSQYGSVFISMPILAAFYLHYLWVAKKDRKKIVIITGAYLVSLIIFALPLWMFFLKIQMANNEISGHVLSLTPSRVLGWLTTLGKILFYFLHLTSEGWQKAGGFLTVLLLCLSVFVIVKRDCDWSKKSVILSLWIAYTVHYFLVCLHIYAMVHPDQSGGFYCRYSYFYLSIIPIVIPAVFHELWKSLGKTQTSRALVFAPSVLLCIVIFSMSLKYTLHNWIKARDNVYAGIWMDNKGWEVPSYMVGGPSFDGLTYYVSTDERYQDGYLDKVYAWADVFYLPPRFWCGWSNWGGGNYHEIIAAAEDIGYDITEYDDGGIGQIAYCEYKEPYGQLDEDTIIPRINGAVIDDCGIVHTHCSFANRVMYNPSQFKYFFHIIDDQNNEVAKSDVSSLGGWVFPKDYELPFDTSKLEQFNDSFRMRLEVYGEETGWFSGRGVALPEIYFSEFKTGISQGE